MKKIASLVLLLSITWAAVAQNVGQEGDTLLNYVDINGLKQGTWKKMYENGQPRFEAYFIDDNPVGKLTRWDSYGNLFAVLNYDNNGINAQAVFYHGNGEIAATGKYYKQLKDSIWLYYDENKKCYLQESYKKGIKHGSFKQFTSENILIEETHWVDGIKQGAWKKFYVNGAPMWEANYSNGKLEGDAKAYYKSGTLQKEGKFVNDLMEGGWLRYNEDGSFEKVLQYKNGVCPELEEENDALLKQLIENKDQIEGPQNSNDLDWLRGNGR